MVESLYLNYFLILLVIILFTFIVYNKWHIKKIVEEAERLEMMNFEKMEWKSGYSTHDLRSLNTDLLHREKVDFYSNPGTYELKKKEKE